MIGSEISYRLFPQIFNMSMTASIVILAVLVIRLLLRKAPKVFSYILWAAVLFRLLCPVSITSEFSVLRLLDVPVTEEGSLEYVPVDIVHTEFPEVNIPVPGVSEAMNENLPQGSEQLAADPLEAPVGIATQVWIIGILVLLLYSLVQYIRLRGQLIGAVSFESPVVQERVLGKHKLHGNIYIADHIDSPFVMGFFRPAIYLPSSLSEEEQGYIIIHEQYHIHRLDHVVRIFAFGALCIHWFNPLVWVAFVLSGKDMEMSCDEAVMGKMQTDIRADYAGSLLSLATGRRILVGTPLAFGEGDTGSRIRNVMNYKKPGFWLVCTAVVVVIIGCVILMTNPVSGLSGFYRWTRSVVASDFVDAKTLEIHRFYGTSAIYCQLTQEDAHELASAFHGFNRDEVIIKNMA